MPYRDAMSTTATDLDLDRHHPGVGGHTLSFTPRQARVAALAWANEQRHDAAQEGRQHAPLLDDLLAGAPGRSDLCPLAFSALMCSVGETTAHTPDRPRFRSRMPAARERAAGRPARVRSGAPVRLGLRHA